MKFNLDLDEWSIALQDFPSLLALPQLFVSGKKLFYNHWNCFEALEMVEVCEVYLDEMKSINIFAISSSRLSSYLVSKLRRH